ncbi:hypothetical protein [Thermus thalpophilus]|uniref:hypothetical protein n=1 Tax=Thermus thalpophilus TaxID=2908147 RepID=UPI001FAAA9B9|nr:hypothetical protein [Thermus thalpophilus]
MVEIGRTYGVHRNTLVEWKSALVEKGPFLFANDTQERGLEKRVRQLAQLIGKKEMETRS